MNLAGDFLILKGWIKYLEIAEWYIAHDKIMLPIFGCRGIFKTLDLHVNWHRYSRRYRLEYHSGNKIFFNGGDLFRLRKYFNQFGYENTCATAGFVWTLRCDSLFF